MRVILVIGIGLFLLVIRVSSAQEGLPPVQPQVNITNAQFKSAQRNLQVNVSFTDLNSSSILIVWIKDYSTNELIETQAIVLSMEQDEPDVSITFDKSDFDESGIYLVTATLLDQTNGLPLDTDVMAAGNGQLEPRITLLEINPPPYDGTVTVTVKGEAPKEVNQIVIRIIQSNNINFSQTINLDNRGDNPSFDEQSDPFELGFIPPSSILVTAELYSDSGQKVADLTNTELYFVRYLDVTNPIYDPMSDKIIITARSSLIEQVKFTINGELVSEIPLISEEPEDRRDPNRLMTHVIELSSSNLLPFASNSLNVTGVFNSGGEIQLEEKLFEYRPPINWFLWNLMRRYWYLFVLIVILFLVIITRQFTWVTRVGGAPLALLPIQRRRAIKHMKRRWQGILDLNQLYPLIGRPRSQGAAAIMLTRARQLALLPNGFDKLTSYVDTVKDILIYLKTNPHLDPFQQHENAILYHIQHILIKDCSELVKKYWHIDKLCSAIHIPPMFLPNFEIELNEATPYLKMLVITIDNLQRELEPYADLFDQNGLHDAYVYLSEMRSGLDRLHVGNIADDIFESFMILRSIQERMQSYISIIREKDNMIKPDLSDLMINNNPIRTALVELQKGVIGGQSFLAQYVRKITLQILRELRKIETIENVILLENLQQLIIGNHFANYLDETIDKLEAIAQEVSSAMAQTPHSYGRRLALQDAHVLMRDLYAILKHEEPVLAAEVQRIALMFEEHKREESETEHLTYDNPYVTGNPIRPERTALFKGRAELASDVVSRLRGGRNSTLLLYGARRMGKSSFLYHLENFLPSAYLSVFVDCQGSATESEASFFYQIAKAIHGVLRKRSLTVGRNVPRPQLDQYKKENPGNIFEEWLREEIAPILNHRILLVTLDEFEEIGNAIKDGRINATILGQLRHLIQHSDYINFMFAGVGTLDALIPNAASYFISVSAIELSYLDNPAAESLIRHPYQPEDTTATLLEGEIGRVPSYDNDAVAKIMYLTHNQPYLIQAMCEQLINIANQLQLSNITQSEVELIAKSLDREYPNYFEFYWKNWGEIGQRILSDLVNGSSLSKTDQRKIRPVIADMLRHRVICQQNDGSYAIETPLMENFLRNRT